MTEEELDTFSRERRGHAWSGETEANPALVVTFDDSPSPVSDGDWSGLQAEDIFVDSERGSWGLWTSTVVPVVTPKATVVLEFNHPGDTLSERAVYTAADVMKYITVLE